MKESDRVSGKKVISLVDLPKAFRFLGAGWFVVQVIASDTRFGVRMLDASERELLGR
jgi:hypothetical protein